MGNPQFSIDLVIHFENSHISGAKFLILMIRPLAPALPPPGGGAHPITPFYQDV